MRGSTRQSPAGASLDDCLPHTAISSKKTGLKREKVWPSCEPNPLYERTWIARQQAVTAPLRFLGPELLGPFRLRR